MILKWNLYFWGLYCNKHRVIPLHFLFPPNFEICRVHLGHLVLALYGKWHVQNCNRLQIVCCTRPLAHLRMILISLSLSGLLELIAMDILSPLPKTSSGNQYVLIFSDHSTIQTRTISATKVSSTYMVSVFRWSLGHPEWFTDASFDKQ